MQGEERGVIPARKGAESSSSEPSALHCVPLCAVEAMPTHVSTPSGVAESPAPGAVSRKAQMTGKGGVPASSARGITNSRFKQKAALATRTSPKTPVVRASKRNTPGHGVKERKGASPPPARAMLTPGAIKQMRQSANGSILGASRQGSVGTSLAAEPSFEQGLVNTSSILSENSTMTMGSVDESLSQRFSMSLSIVGRDSFDSVRDSIGSVRNSGLVPFSALVSTQDAASSARHHDASVIFESRLAELQTENSELRSQLESYKVRASSFGLALFYVPWNSLASHTPARLLQLLAQHVIQLYPWLHTCETVYYRTPTSTIACTYAYPHI